MSMLRFVLRKINVIHNSLIKFWSVRNSNEGASLFQSIAQAKVKLRLDEAGRVSKCLIFFLALLFGIFLICYYGLNLSLWWSLGWSLGLPTLSIGIKITFTFVVNKIRTREYFQQLFIIDSVKINWNRHEGKVKFYDYNIEYSNEEKGSTIIDSIKNLQEGGIIYLEIEDEEINESEDCDLFIMEKICDKVDTNQGIKIYPYRNENSKNIEVLSDTEIHVVFVSWYNQEV